MPLKAKHQALLLRLKRSSLQLKMTEKGTNSLMVLTMAARISLLNEAPDIHSGDLFDRSPVSILLFLHCFSLTFKINCLH